MLQGEPGPVGPAGSTGPRGGPVSYSINVTHICKCSQYELSHYELTHDISGRNNRKNWVEKHNECRRFSILARNISAINIPPCSVDMLGWSWFYLKVQIQRSWQMVHYLHRDVGASFMIDHGYFRIGIDFCDIWLK